MASAWAGLSDDDAASASEEAWADLSDDGAGVSVSEEAWADLSDDGASGEPVDDESDHGLHGEPVDDGDVVPLAAVDDEFGHGLHGVALPRGRTLRAPQLARCFRETREAARLAKQGFQRAAIGGDAVVAPAPQLAADAHAAVAGDHELALALPPLPPAAGDPGVEQASARSLFSELRAASQCLEQSAHVLAIVGERFPSHELISGSDVERRALSHLLDGNTTCSSDASAAAGANTDVRTLRRLRGLTAVGMMLVTVADSIRMLTRVADGILSAGGKCLTLLERFKADESTMTFKVADREPTKVPGVYKALAVTSTSLEATAHQSARLRCCRATDR